MQEQHQWESKFQENEKVLCYQQGYIYPAKCLKWKRTSDGELHYLVHYAGFSKTHDEWVDECRVLKDNEENEQKRLELAATCERPIKLNKQKKVLNGGGKLRPDLDCSNNVTTLAASTITTSTCLKDQVKVVPVAKQVSTEQQLLIPIERKESVPEKKVYVKPEKPIYIPRQLKSLIGDDNILINVDKMLFSLPAKITVEKIVFMYVQEQDSDVTTLQTEEENNTKEERDTNLATLQELFNVQLPSSLLHKFERRQLGQMLDKHPNLSNCQIYGVPHFVRFFYKMEETIRRACSADDSNKQTIRRYCQSIIDFIDNNLSKLFSVDEYIDASDDYCRQALSLFV